MLALSPWTAPPSSTAHAFRPAISSPLAPRSANIYGRRPTMTDKPNVAEQPPRREAPRPFSQRSIKTAPKARHSDLQEKRRGAFMQKIRDSRDQKRFEIHEDDMMRDEFVREQRRWQAEQAQSAPRFELTDDYDDDAAEMAEDFDLNFDDDMDMVDSSLPARYEEDEVEMFLRDEDAELEALLESIPMETSEEPPGYADSEHFGSDMDDYDGIFAEYLSQTENQDNIMQD